MHIKKMAKVWMEAITIGYVIDKVDGVNKLGRSGAYEVAVKVQSMAANNMPRRPPPPIDPDF